MIRILLFLLIPFNLLPLQVRAQPVCDILWDDSVRITTDEVLSNLPSIAAAGEYVHILWYGQDTIGGTPGSGIHYTRSSDTGATFDPPRLILPFDQAVNIGLLAADGPLVHIAAPAILDTFLGLVAFHSGDGGATWSPPVRILQGAYPEALAARRSAVYIHYRNPQSGQFGLVRSADGGQSWTVAASRTNEFTSMVADSVRLHAVGPVFGASGLETGYSVSLDSGRRWSTPRIISPDDFVRSAGARLAINERRHLFCVWTDSGAVMTRGSRNGGVTWGTVAVLSDGPGNVSAAVSAGQEFTFAAWDRDVAGENGVEARLSNDFGATYCPPDQPSASTAAREPAVAVSLTRVHTAWVGLAGTDLEIYYRRGLLQENPDVVTRPPANYLLRQSYPNPTNSTAIIEYDIPEAGSALLEIFDARGARVTTLVEGDLPAGRYQTAWEVAGYATGVYFYRLRAGSFEGVRKLLIIR